MQIGVVGLGNIGGSVARRLMERDFQVAVYDINRERVEELAKLGALGMSSGRELMSKIDIVITSLPNDQILNAAVLGEEGLLAYAKEGQTLIELSTVLPQTVISIAEQAKTKGVRVLDCPISGGPKEAIRGDLSLIVSGPEGIVSDYKYILMSIGAQILYVSNQIGEAKAIKLINNMMTMGNVLIAAEAFAVGMSYGIDPGQLYDILSQTGGKSHHFVKRFPKVVANDYSSWFSMELGDKDLALALEWAKQQNLELEVTPFVKQYYEEGMNQGMAHEDFVAVTKLFQKQFAGKNKSLKMEGVQ